MTISNFQRYYGNMIWTDHVVERLNKRHISQVDALKVMKHPDKTYPGKSEGTVKFIRTLNNRRIHIVGKLNPDGQWLVLTAWVRGEEDQLPLWERLIRFVLSGLYRALCYLVRWLWSLLRGNR